MNQTSNKVGFSKTVITNDVAVKPPINFYKFRFFGWFYACKLITPTTLEALLSSKIMSKKPKQWTTSKVSELEMTALENSLNKLK